VRRALLLALLALAAGAAPASAADHGITVTASRALSPRLTDLTMTTAALAAPTHVRILVPAGYDANPARRYPVLYLLHGSYDDYRSWTDKGAAEKITAGLDAIVVMPDNGNGGWYTDWFRPGPPRWETFHIGQLLPWVDEHYRTIPTRGERAIAGLSMGGFGAMSYAARHPDLFSWAASFSGAVDIVNNATVAAVIDIEAPADGGQPGDQFGDRVLNVANWRAHNPWDLAANLRNTRLRLDTGNGQPGPYDKGRLLPDPIEQQVREMGLSLHKKLGSLGIAHVWDDYGPGTHSWPYWQRDLRQSLPSLEDSFAHPLATPRRFTYTSAASSYEVYGWRVSVTGGAGKLDTLQGAGARGFLFSGAGTATVRTAPLYRPRSRHTVTIAAERRVLRADRLGRLRIALPAGARVRIG
jgi:diacylglycerol O-acyltransferase / trehalose O-mycolyltransferase